MQQRTPGRMAMGDFGRCVCQRTETPSGQAYCSHATNVRGSSREQFLHANLSTGQTSSPAMGAAARKQHADRATAGAGVTTPKWHSATVPFALPVNLLLNRMTMPRDSLPAVVFADARSRAA